MAGADWQAAGIRVALFTQQALPLGGDIFTGFAGTPPDVQEDRPKEGVRRQLGVLDAAELQVTITPIRVDIVVAPPPIKQEDLGGALVLSTGELKAELAKFERRILAWLPRWETPTIRASLVVTARAPADSTEAAYEILKNNLSSVQIRPGMSDVLFRVNWNAKTTVIPEGFYNRLSTWAAAKVAASTFAMPGRPEIIIQSLDFAQFELDLNTPAERAQALPQKDLPNIFREFFQLAMRVADVGEGP